MTVTMSAPVGAPVLRLLPAPSAEPPFDDEDGAAPVVVDGSLALSFPPSATPTVPLRVVPPAQRPHDPPDRQGRASRLPDARLWAGRLTQVVIEVLAGDRAAGQLSGYATLAVLDRLEGDAARLRPRSGSAPALRPVVRTVRVHHPVDGVAEVCAVIDTGQRRRALALRLEAIEARWQCTALVVG